EAQRLFVAEGAYNGHIQPAFKERNTPIVICFDDNYAHAGGALLRSIIEHSSADTNYDILILEDGVSEVNKSHFKEMTRKEPNFEVRFFGVAGFSEMDGVHTRAHFSPATYA